VELAGLAVGIFAAQRAAVAAQVGEDEVRAAEDVLLVLTGRPPGSGLADLPGWLAGGK